VKRLSKNSRLLFLTMGMTFMSLSSASYAHLKLQDGGALGRRLHAFKTDIDRPLAAIHSASETMTIRDLFNRLLEQHEQFTLVADVRVMPRPVVMQTPLPASPSTAAGYAESSCLALCSARTRTSISSCVL
jgi:hypothetical protein